MSDLARQMAMYHAYHRHAGTKATHFVGVPPIYWSVMLLFSIAPLRWGAIGPVPVSAALVGTLALAAFYVKMDWRIGTVAAGALGVMLWGATALALRLTTTQALLVFLGVQVVAWAFQIFGHTAFEKNRPALLDNLLQALIALIFLVAEVAFALGTRRELADEVERESLAYAPAAA